MSQLSVLIGAITGILSGLGVGGGSLLVLFLTAVCGYAPYHAGGINLLYFIGCAPAALWQHLRSKQVNIRATLWCAMGGSILVVPSSWIAAHIETELLKRLFGILVLCVAIREWRQSNVMD